MYRPGACTPLASELLFVIRVPGSACTRLHGGPHALGAVSEDELT